MKERRLCPCCGYLSLNSELSDYEICPICFWENDLVQQMDPTYTGGANVVCLREARENYRKYGVSEKRFKHSVREPKKEEFP